MLEHELTTLQLVWREGPLRFRARDPFAVGGVVEDPATGAAAAAFGAYLRDLGEIGRPRRSRSSRASRWAGRAARRSTIVPGDPRVRVSGTAVPIPG